MQVIAEAFKEKEIEVIVLQDALVLVEQQFQVVQATLEIVKGQELTTNQDLAAALKQLSTSQVFFRFKVV